MEEQNGSLLSQLSSQKPTTNVKDWQPETAAVESCRIVDQEGFYPGRLVDAAYVGRYKDTLVARLQLAGHRLAALLNQAIYATPLR